MIRKHYIREMNQQIGDNFDDRPDDSDNKLTHQVTPHKILEPAQLAKTTQEIWPGLQNKLKCDSSPCTLGPRGKISSKHSLQLPGETLRL